MNKICLVVGDWSGDGHSRTDDYIFNVNLSEDEIKDAFKKGSEKIGFDLSDQCKNYEEDKISSEYAKKLINLGVDIESIGDYDEENDDSVWINSEEFADAYMAIAKLGNPELEYSTDAGVKDIHIGGYGLFY